MSPQYTATPAHAQYRGMIPWDDSHPAVVSQNSNQACFAAPTHASPFRGWKDQLRSRWGWFEANLRHSQALQRARQTKREGALPVLLPKKLSFWTLRERVSNHAAAIGDCWLYHAGVHGTGDGDHRPLRPAQPLDRWLARLYRGPVGRGVGVLRESRRTAAAGEPAAVHRRAWLWTGRVIWVFISEIFPNRVRARGQALGSYTHWAMNAGISWTFPDDRRRRLMAFAFYAVCMVGQLVWALLVMQGRRHR